MLPLQIFLDNYDLILSGLLAKLAHQRIVE